VSVPPDDPTMPGDPATPTGPPEPGTPASPAEPATPIVPAEPATPLTPAGPATPLAPAEPATPPTPGAPAEPTTPPAPATPRVPADFVPPSASPTAPAEPAVPTPASPASPTEPAPPGPPADPTPPTASEAAAAPPAAPADGQAEPAAPQAAAASAPSAAPATSVSVDVPADEPPAPGATPPADPSTAATSAPDPPPLATPPAGQPTSSEPTLDAGLAAAAATTAELAPPPSVPVPYGTAYDPASGAEPTDRRRVALPALLTALVLLATGGLLWFYGPPAKGRDAVRLADRRADAYAQSRQLALNLVSIDYKTLDRDLKRIADSTTGKARDEFDKKILSNEAYKSLVKDNEAVLTSTINRIGLEPCGSGDKACKRGDRVTVLVFLDQESKNKLRPTPRVDRNRVVLTLVRVRAHWLVSDVAVV
jgi:hypothetical protein